MNIKIGLKIYKYMLHFFILAIIVTLTIIGINKYILNRNIQKCSGLINKVMETSKFKDYDIAKQAIETIKQPNIKEQLLNELYKSNDKVFTPDISNAARGLYDIQVKKDLYSYENLLNNILLNVQDEEEVNYIRSKAMELGQKIVFTDKLKASIDALDKAWSDPSYINEAQTKLVNNLSYYNIWDMCYLQRELNYIKSKQTQKKQILIVGDSITLGMASEYKRKKPLCNIDNAWWNYLTDDDKNEFSLVAVGGIGVIEGTNSEPSLSIRALDIAKFHNEVFKGNKNYDTVIIALSTNDEEYSDDEYKNALEELTDYIKSNYTFKNLAFINFDRHEEAMKDVSDYYKAKYIDIDMKNISKTNPKIDTTHPSKEGHKQIADILIQNKFLEN